MLRGCSSTPFTSDKCVLESDRQTPCVWPVPERSISKTTLQTERSWWVSGLSDKVCLYIEPHSWASCCQMRLRISIKSTKGTKRSDKWLSIPCNQTLTPLPSLGETGQGKGSMSYGCRIQSLTICLFIESIFIFKPSIFAKYTLSQSIHYISSHYTLRHLRPSQQATAAHPAQQGLTSLP